MGKVIKNIKRCFLGLVNRIRWQLQYQKLAKGLRRENCVQREEWYKNSKILLIVPHADDELISSYTLLRRSNDITIYYCGFTGSNNSETNRVTRRNEIIKICSELKVRIIEGNGDYDNLEQVIEHGQYDKLLLPSLVDWHPEHRIISYMIQVICEKNGISPAIYTYSVTVPNESKKQLLCNPMTKEELDLKYNLFSKVYLSQRMMPVERLKLNERLNGFHSRCYAAEVFQEHGFEEWSNRVREIEPLEGLVGSELLVFASEVRKNLNDLLSVRKASNAFYAWLEEK